jgi:hypothetical protein
MAAAALYGAALVDGFLHAGRFAPAFAPAGVIGGALLLAALVRGGGGALGWALAIAGAMYVGALEATGRRVDGTAVLLAACLLLCGELARWSVDARVRIRGDELLVRRRAAALAVLSLSGLAAAGIALGLAAAPTGHGLVWTVVGAAAAVGAAGTGSWLARRSP